MIEAAAQFFPDRDYEKDPTKAHQLVEEIPDIPLRRVNTGVTSIVGLDNGERPGGCVLVVDGAALLEVSSNY